eukprot:CAMPEP_0113897814 /NCGR_PEP_ID=MMETSP0780_2-20120614/18950_1 /TAXON_ID=652834 /ORGANISM="Palpitomonas bilix" /LENGTH=653 /DNA_ID=CAMNT_0000889443 /DNA_START=53 /DNA_END=2014 /DNA_ORIENTATION=+ /assembly_acc=CAM_ASM_000599
MTETTTSFDFIVAISFDSTLSASEEEKCSLLQICWAVVSNESKEVVHRAASVLHHDGDVDEAILDALDLTSEQLREGRSLKEAVKEIDSHCFLNFTSENLSFCFATDNVQFFEHDFRSICAKNGVRLAAHFDKFFSIGTEEKVNASGRCSQLCEKLQEADGEELGATMVVVGAVQKAQQDPSSAFTSSTAATAAAAVAAAVVGGGEDGLRKLHPLRLRGLPFAMCTPEDVQAFFKPLLIHADDIVICKGANGRYNGEAFITFNSESERAAALRRDREQLGGRYIELFVTTEEDYRAKKEEFSSMNGASVGSTEKKFVRMRGFPFQANEEDVVEFMAKGSISAEVGQVKLVMGSDGRKTGEAFVEFASPEEAQKASVLHKLHHGSRYIEVYMSNEIEMKEMIERRSQRPAGPSSHFSGDANGSVVKMRGLPFSASYEDIAEFFSDCGIASSGIHFVTGPDGRSCGEAFVVFTSPQEAEKAMRHNRENIGHRYVELFRASQQEMGQMGGGDRWNRHDSYYSHHHGGHRHDAYPPYDYYRDYSYPPHDPYRQDPYQSYRYGSSQSAGGHSGSGGVIVSLRGLPWSASPAEVMSFFTSAGHNPIQDSVCLIKDNRGRASGKATVEFTTAADAERAISDRNRAMMGTRYIEMSMGPGY